MHPQGPPPLADPQTGKQSQRQASLVRLSPPASLLVNPNEASAHNISRVNFLLDLTRPSVCPDLRAAAQSSHPTDQAEAPSSASAPQPAGVWRSAALQVSVRGPIGKAGLPDVIRLRRRAGLPPLGRSDSKHCDRSSGAAPSAAAPARCGRPNTGTSTAATVQKGPEPPLLSPRLGQQQLPRSRKRRSRLTGTAGGHTTQGAELLPLLTG
ncbi:hypothetical protein NDU88_004641 [Pleurodeles waltl]|uniref:Uncharacterized protein n=1 Tax=Pleurodeles waltl TaxID=8319 RepID=A0AAV7N211_PLEWA|nr:hypothetical protein NDU88_004641 [Pleurodeles waltl]